MILLCQGSEAQAARDIADLQAQYDSPIAGFTDLWLRRVIPIPWPARTGKPATWEELAKVWRRTIEAEQRPIARVRGRTR